MLQVKDTFVYVVKNQGEIVLMGVSNDFEATQDEHDHSSMEFTEIRPVTEDMTGEQAELVLEKLLSEYRQTHEGLNPLYNF
ncbi:hypothetical protein [Poriferisphaera sp. WC338]|uniref:hypothetical protein n=1 Tax=Poriferisphaera sp. WC338 TaxID=3425129 RepID=UPI003D815E4D